MAEIDGGGLSFTSQLDNSQLDAAIQETMRRVQGLSDGVVGVGDSVDKTVAEIGTMLGKIGEECEKQETAIWKLEDEFEALKQLASQEWEKNGFSAEYKALKDKQKAIQGEITVRKQLLTELRNQSSQLDDARDAMIAEAKATQENEKSQTSLRQRLRELKMEMVELEAAGQRNTARYREVAAEAARLTDAWGDAQAQANILANDDAGFAGVLSGLTGLTGGFSAVAGMVGLFGEQNEDLQQIMLKTQSIMAITNGLMQVSQALNKDSAFMLGTVGKLKEWWNGLLEVGRNAQAEETTAVEANTLAQGENAATIATNTTAEEVNTAANQANAAARGKATTATTANTAVQGANTTAIGAQAVAAKAGTVANIGLAGAFRMVGAAIKSIPVFGWILAGISALIGLYSHFASKASEAKKAQEEFSKALVDGCYKPIGKIEELSVAWTALGDNLEAKEAFVRKNKASFDELGISIDGVTAAENVLVNNKQAFIDAQIEKAKALAYIELGMAKLKQALQNREDAENVSLNWIEKIFSYGGAGEKMLREKRTELTNAALGLEAEMHEYFERARQAEANGNEILSNALIETNEVIAGSLGDLNQQIANKRQELLKSLDAETYKKVMGEIEALQKKADAITGTTTTHRTGGGGGGSSTTKDPFLEKLQKRKTEYQRFMKWLNSGDEILVQSANQEFATLLQEGATYIDYLKRQRDQILEIDVANRTKAQNKQLRQLNDAIAEETKQTVLEQFNQELSEQLTNAKSVIDMLNIIERRRQELANDGTELDNGKKTILDDAEKDARKQAREQTEELLKEYASYTDKRLELEREFNRDIEMLNRARAAATTDADRASIDAAIANRRRKYQNDTKGTGDTDYDALIEQYQGYEQKRATIAGKYAEQRRVALEHNDKEMLARIADAEANELADLSNEIVTKSSDWQMLFGNLEGLTTSTIQRLIKNIEAQKIQFSGEFNPADLQAINEQLEKARDEINSRNPFKALGNAFSELRRQMSDNALLSNDNDPFLASLKAKEAEYQQYQKWIQSGDKTLVQGSQDAFAGLLSQGGNYLDFLKRKKQELQGKIDMGVDVGNSMQVIDALIRKVESGKSAGDMMKEALKDVFSNVGSTLSLVSGTFNSVVSGMEKMGIAMDEETQAILGDIGGILEGAQQAAEGIASGNPLAVIQGSISLISSAVDLFDSRSRKAEKAIKRHKEQLTKLQNVYKQLEWQIDKALGLDEYEASMKAIQNMRKQQQELLGMINAEKSKKGKKSDASKIEEYTEQIRELDRAIEDMYDEISKNILQTDAKSFSDSLSESLVSAFEKGEDAAKAFEETVNDVLKNAIVNQLKKKFLEQQLQGALDNLESSMGYWNGDDFIFDGLTDSEIEAFKRKVQAAANNFNQALGIYSDLFKDLTDEEDSDTSLTGAVKGVSEETASLVAGQMNAIRINQLEIKDTLRQQLLVLNQIAANTAFNKHLAKIDQIITILESNGGNSLRSQGLI
ncbi:MAG: hypothetical protein NC401_04185 [Ruminococcus sp.]|nr:hypothetical protein [Ruminococcus sp.]